MKFSEVELPSNKKFGGFFTFLFFVISVYFFFNGSAPAGYIFSTLAGIFLICTLIKADLLLPLNKIWMRFGLLLGTVVGPVVLGLIFFVIFTPIAFLMRLVGRDELRLKFKEKNTHWIKRGTPMQTDSFNHQF